MEVERLCALIDGLTVHAVLNPHRMGATTMTRVLQHHLQSLTRQCCDRKRSPRAALRRRLAAFRDPGHTLLPYRLISRYGSAWRRAIALRRDAIIEWTERRLDLNVA